MLDLARYLPALLLVGGAGVAAKGGGDVTRKLLDTVKVVVTRFEMGAVAQAIEIDATMGGSVPTGDKLSAYIKANVKSRTGRDPTRDLWGHPYRIARTEGRLALVSNGPNGHRDRCHEKSLDRELKDFKDAVDEDERRAVEAAERQAQALRLVVEGGDDLDPDDLAAKVAQTVPERRPTGSPGPLSRRAGADDVCVYLALEARGRGGGGDVFGGQSPYRRIKP